MKIGIIISTNNPETAWNAIRLANTAIQEKHEAKIFLLNSGVEIEQIPNDKFDIKQQIKTFNENNGQILACGTCIKNRQQKETKTCPISTMKDLLKLIEESDKIITFG